MGAASGCYGGELTAPICGYRSSPRTGRSYDRSQFFGLVGEEKMAGTASRGGLADAHRMQAAVRERVHVHAVADVLRQRVSWFSP